MKKFNNGDKVLITATNKKDERVCGKVGVVERDDIVSHGGIVYGIHVPGMINNRSSEGLFWIPSTYLTRWRELNVGDRVYISKIDSAGKIIDLYNTDVDIPRFTVLLDDLEEFECGEDDMRKIEENKKKTCPRY